MAQDEKQAGVYRRWAAALRDIAAEPDAGDRDMLIRAAEVYERITRRLESVGAPSLACSASQEAAFA